MSDVKKKKRSNIFTKYFLIFVTIFLIGFVALGATLLILVNAYSIDEKTELLKENSNSIATNVAETLIVNDMNSSYSSEKALICESLETISNCIDSDVFVCDVEGNVILCKEQVGVKSYRAESMVCDEHESFKFDDALLQSVYENGMSVTRTNVNGVSCYVVGRTIVAPRYAASDNEESGIIGLVFATVQEGTTELVLRIIRNFVVILIAVLLVASVVIWLLTKKMVTPLQQMSAAAKRFAVGDFSYRVKIDSNDELSDLGYAFNDMAEALDKLEAQGVRLSPMFLTS